MRRAALAAAVLGAAAAACDVARVAGGVTVAPGAEPKGVLVSRWRVADCRSASGRDVPSPGVEVLVIRQIDGRLVLVDAREGYDTLVVENRVVENRAASPREHVFQVALKRASDAPYLREYRVPASGTSPGRFAVVRDFTDREAAGGFVASYTDPTLVCTLVPHAS